MFDLLPEDAQVAFLELMSRSFNPRTPIEEFSAIPGATEYFLREGVYFLNDISYENPQSPGFTGNWWFGDIRDQRKPWITGVYSGMPTQKGLERFTLEEIYNIQHRPFIDKIKGLRIGEFNDEWTLTTPSQRWLYTDQIYPPHLKGPRFVGGLEKLSAFLPDQHRWLTVYHGIYNAIWQPDHVAKGFPAKP